MSDLPHDIDLLAALQASRADEAAGRFVVESAKAHMTRLDLLLDPALLHKLVTLEMPFGKYKGHILADLPGNYLAWFARAGFPKGELGRLLSLMLEIDHNGLAPLLAPLRGTVAPPSESPKNATQPPR